MEELGKARLGQLTTRELRIATLVTRSWSNKKIALELCVSEQSIKNHLHRIFNKMGVWSRLELALLITRVTYEVPPSTAFHSEHG